MHTTTVGVANRAECLVQYPHPSGFWHPDLEGVVLVGLFPWSASEFEFSYLDGV